MDDLTALRLQIEWGADEALLDAALDRTAPARPARAVLAPASLRAVPPVAAANLAALHAELDAFHAHPLRATASHTVAPSGNPAAGLVLLADAPGPDDDRSGQAFTGAAGALLDRVLASAGLDREALLLAHLVPWRPPGGRPPSREELALCLPYLHRLLGLAAPRYLVLMGAACVRALLPEAPGRRTRGQWRPATVSGLPHPVPALAMPPPDQWLRDARSRQATWSDLLLLRTTLDAPRPP